MSLRVLITGASGFIGSSLCLALVKTGYHVRAASRIRTASLNLPAIQWVELRDLAEDLDWAPFLTDIDVVIHLAAIAHRHNIDGHSINRINCQASTKLVRACRSFPIRRFMFMSSIGAQAGSAADEIVTEQDVPKPVTLYDQSKLAAEEDVRSSGVPFTIFRPVTVYGPGARANISTLLRVSALPIPLPFGAFRNRRSLLSIDNLVDAVVFCLNCPATTGRTFILSDPEPIALSEAIAVLRRARGRARNLVPIPPKLIEIVLRLAGQAALWDRLGRELVADSRSLQELGWIPQIRTEEGLSALVRPR